MKKIWNIITISFLAFLIITLMRLYHYYAPATELTPYPTIQHNDDTLRLAYIGDSWAFMHKKYDAHLSKQIENELKCPTKVISYGNCGLTSKGIYESLFNDPQMRKVISSGQTYCYISAGINDTYKKMSFNYYHNNMKNILEFMIKNNITPIVQEIPDYDIEKAYHNQSISKKLLRRLSMCLNRTPLDCKQMYRDTFNKLIAHESIKDKIIVIRYEEWDNKYPKDLNNLYLNDGMHLNNKGYAILDSIIIKHLQINKE